MPRYRFGDFVLSPRRRALLRGGEVQPLIPRYFDLLVYLVERRGEAVHRREIFDRVWNDVIVSDSALSQAVRTIRRTLGDDSREPRFVRTVSRHGYQFVGIEVVEEDDTLDIGAPVPLDRATPEGAMASTDPFAPLLDRVTAEAGTLSDEDQRDAAEALHALGTAEALRRLGTRPGHARARALLRDTRWDVARAGDVPVRHAPSAVAVAWHVVVLRLARAAVAETVLRSRRTAALVAGGALGGGVVGLAAQWMARWTLAALAGLNVAMGGGLDGLALGGAAALGHAAATRGSTWGVATPRGPRRWRTLAVTALACGLAALALAAVGRPLVGGTIHMLSMAFAGAQVALTPLARLLGEPDFGPASAALLGLGEGALFGAGLAFGLTRRP